MNYNHIGWGDIHTPGWKTLRAVKAIKGILNVHQLMQYWFYISLYIVDFIDWHSSPTLLRDCDFFFSSRKLSFLIRHFLGKEIFFSSPSGQEWMFPFKTEGSSWYLAVGKSLSQPFRNYFGICIFCFRKVLCITWQVREVYYQCLSAEWLRFNGAFWVP